MKFSGRNIPLGDTAVKTMLLLQEHIEAGSLEDVPETRGDESRRRGRNGSPTGGGSFLFEATRPGNISVVSDMNSRIWTLVADSVNPALTLVLLGAGLSGGEAGLGFLGRSALALAVVELLAKGLQHHHLLAGRFPSTHFAYALCISTSILFLRPKWALWLLPVLAGYAWLMVQEKFHVWRDIAGATMAVPLTAPVHMWRRPVARPSLAAE